jgi:hypothetical protein
VKAVRECGDLIPRYSQHLMSSLLSGVRDTDEFVRASSLSNIGEVCKLLRFSVGPIIQEVGTLFLAVLTESELGFICKLSLSLYFSDALRLQYSSDPHPSPERVRFT